MNFLDFIFKKLNPKEAQIKNISLNKEGRAYVIKDILCDRINVLWVYLPYVYSRRIS